MTLQEKIIKYMEIKARNLPFNLGEIYLKQEDKEAVRDWDDKKAELCFKRLKYAIQYKVENNLFTCPFCLVYNYFANEHLCDKCEYGKTHGICCESEPNDYEYVS